MVLHAWLAWQGDAWAAAVDTSSKGTGMEAARAQHAPLPLHPAPLSAWQAPARPPGCCRASMPSVMRCCGQWQAQQGPPRGCRRAAAGCPRRRAPTQRQRPAPGAAAPTAQARGAGTGATSLYTVSCDTKATRFYPTRSSFPPPFTTAPYSLLIAKARAASYPPALAVCAAPPPGAAPPDPPLPPSARASSSWRTHSFSCSWNTALVSCSCSRSSSTRSFRSPACSVGWGKGGGGRQGPGCFQACPCAEGGQLA